MGSLERFFGVLVEHYAGAFPLWLAPVQAKILTITDNQNDYAEEIAKMFEDAGIRIEIDNRGEKLGLKIREAQLKKIPYMLVVGKNEVEEGKVSVRSRQGGDMGSKSVEELIALLTEEIKEKR